MVASLEDSESGEELSGGLDATGLSSLECVGASAIASWLSFCPDFLGVSLSFSAEEDDATAAVPEAVSLLAPTPKSRPRKDCADLAVFWLASSFASREFLVEASY